MKTVSIDLQQLTTREVYGLLLSSVIPRPIAFASTVSTSGDVNLSPYSFFNCFGSNPPILVFAPASRVRDNTVKHTLENVREVPEVVIGIVNFSISEQMSLSSTEYDRGVNEFVKSGLTPLPSEVVTPPRVAECPVSFECRVREIIDTGEEGGAGHLVVCEVLQMHIHEEILGEDGNIDPFRLDAIARLGGNYYARVAPGSIFEITKPGREQGIGVDALPAEIRESKVLTGNDLGQLGNVSGLPDKNDLKHWIRENGIDKRLRKLKSEGVEYPTHVLAKEYLVNRKVEEAWKVLLWGD